MAKEKVVETPRKEDRIAAKMGPDAVDRRNEACKKNHGPEQSTQWKLEKQQGPPSFTQSKESTSGVRAGIASRVKITLPISGRSGSPVPTGPRAGPREASGGVQLDQPERKLFKQLDEDAVGCACYTEAGDKKEHSFTENVETRGYAAIEELPCQILEDNQVGPENICGKPILSKEKNMQLKGVIKELGLDGPVVPALREPNADLNIWIKGRSHCSNWVRRTGQPKWISILQKLHYRRNG